MSIRSKCVSVRHGTTLKFNRQTHPGQNNCNSQYYHDDHQNMFKTLKMAPKYHGITLPNIFIAS